MPFLKTYAWLARLKITKAVVALRVALSMHCAGITASTGAANRPAWLRNSLFEEAFICEVAMRRCVLICVNASGKGFVDPLPVRAEMVTIVPVRNFILSRKFAQPRSPYCPLFSIASHL